MRKIILKMRYFERRLSENHQKVNLIPLHPFLLWAGLWETKGACASRQSLFGLKNMFEKFLF